MIRLWRLLQKKKLQSSEITQSINLELLHYKQIEHLQMKKLLKLKELVNKNLLICYFKKVSNIYFNYFFKVNQTNQTYSHL